MSSNREETQDGFIDSHAFFLTILMVMFAAAIVVSLIGFTTPSWLGFH